MKKLYCKGSDCIRICGAVLAFLLCAFNFSAPMRKIRNMPAAVFAEDDEELSVLAAELYPNARGGAVSASYRGDETLDSGSISISLFGAIKLRSIPAYVAPRSMLHPGGNSIGITIYTRGVLVVGYGSFTNSAGEKCDPSQKAGIRPGDLIVSVGGTQVNTSEELQVALNANRLGAELLIDRGGRSVEITVIPETASDGTARIGAWVRDSTVGIGTLSFYDENTGLITALGHAVIDADTGRTISVRSGDMRYAHVLGVVKGAAGVPGEIQGTFSDASTRLGSILGNGELGIFGMGDGDVGAAATKSALPIAFPDEVTKGDAYILSDVDGRGPEAYSCRILKASRQSEPGSKGLVIEITDERLLNSTGGIVQGMSGSPIIKDGQLAGVVTHVFVNDPTKGYGIYAYWMLTGARE